MVRPVNTSSDATWKQCCRAPSIFFATIASLAPERGLVWTNLSGVLKSMHYPFGYTKGVLNPNDP